MKKTEDSQVDAAIVVLTTVSPYKTSLSAAFTLVGVHDYEVEFENATNYVKVTINTNNYYGDLKVSWNEDFSPDNTHPMMKNWNDSTKTGTLSVAEQNSYELIFFKNSPSANYVSGIQVSLEE